MPEPLVYLESMGAAAIVSTLCLLAMAGKQRPVTATRVNAACILAICVGIWVGNAVLSPRLVWPPVSALDRLMTIVLPAALGIELIAGFKWIPRSVGWVLRLGLVIAISPILLHGSIYFHSTQSGWSAGETGTTLVACTALLAGIWALLEWLSHRSAAGVSISLALVLAIQTAGLTVMMAGYLKGGAAAFPLAATLAATTLSAWLAAKRIPPAIVGIGVVQLFGVLFIGRFFGRLSTGSAVIMLLAPLLCWVAEIIPLRPRNAWLTGALRLVLVAIPLLAVLIAAKRNFDRDMAPLLGSVQTSFFCLFIFLSTFRH